jgi:hypothetical protein
MLSKTICPQEGAIARAVRTGHWNESLKAHAAGCSRCREVMLAAQAMQSLALPREGDSMPPASRIWCLALLEQKQREASRARRSLAAANLGISAVLLLASVGWLAWNWPQLQSQLTAWRASFLPQLWRAAWLLAEQALALGSFPALALLVLLAAAALLLAQPLWAED